MNNEKLYTAISGIKGVTFASIVTESIPDMRKTDNPFFGKVKKTSRFVAIIGNWSYENSVKNQFEREGLDVQDIEIKPRKWGSRIRGTSIVEHKGSYYLEAKIEKYLESHYFDDNGNTIDKQLLTPYLKTRSDESSTQSDLEKKVILRDIKFESIKEITFNHETIS